MSICHSCVSWRALTLWPIMALAVTLLLEPRGDGAELAWTIGDNKTTVMDAGLYNLTENESTLLVHYGTKKTDQ